MFIFNNKCLILCSKVKKTETVVAQCVRLFVTPQTVCSPLGSFVHGVLQARRLEWVSPSLGDLPDAGIKPGLLHCRQILYHLSYLKAFIRYYKESYHTDKAAFCVQEQ